MKPRKFKPKPTKKYVKRKQKRNEPRRSSKEEEEKRGGFFRRLWRGIKKAVRGIVNFIKKIAKAVVTFVKALSGFVNFLKKVAEKVVNVIKKVAKAVGKALKKIVAIAKKVLKAIGKGLVKAIKAIAKSGWSVKICLQLFQRNHRRTHQSWNGPFKGIYSVRSDCCLRPPVRRGINPEPIINFIIKAGQAILAILKNPFRFLKTIIKAIKELRLKSFLETLKVSEIGPYQFLFGQLGKAGISVPSKWDAKGIFSVMLQVAGVTRDNIIGKVEETGKEAADKINIAIDAIDSYIANGMEGLLDFIENGVMEFVQGLIEDKIVDYVQKNIINAAAKKLLKLFTPVGGLLEAIKSIYTIIKFFITNIGNIFKVLTNLVEALIPAAKGKTEQAVEYLLSGMTKAIPRHSILVGFTGVG